MTGGRRRGRSTCGQMQRQRPFSIKSALPGESGASGASSVSIAPSVSSADVDDGLTL